MLAIWMWYPVSAALLLFLQLIRPAVNRRRPATESGMMALGPMMKPPWLYQFSSISRPPPPGTTMRTVPCMSRSLTLCWSRRLCAPSFPPSVVSQSQLSVCCVVLCCAPRCQGLLPGSVAGQGGRTSGENRGGERGVMSSPKSGVSCAVSQSGNRDCVFAKMNHSTKKRRNHRDNTSFWSILSSKRILSLTKSLPLQINTFITCIYTCFITCMQFTALLKDEIIVIFFSWNANYSIVRYNLMLSDDTTPLGNSICSHRCYNVQTFIVYCAFVREWELCASFLSLKSREPQLCAVFKLSTRGRCWVIKYCFRNEAKQAF